MNAETALHNNGVPSASEMEFPQNSDSSQKTRVENEKTTPRLPRDCPEIALKTYLAIAQNPNATIDELSKITGKSTRTIKNHIALLKNKFIKRIGSDTKGHWEIVEDGEQK